MIKPMANEELSLGGLDVGLACMPSFSFDFKQKQKDSVPTFFFLASLACPESRVFTHTVVNSNQQIVRPIGELMAESAIFNIITIAQLGFLVHLVNWEMFSRGTVPHIYE